MRVSTGVECGSEGEYWCGVLVRMEVVWCVIVRLCMNY